MTNEIAANAPMMLTHIDPHAAAYTFKEWFGVISMICAAIYSAAHAAFLIIVHYGGLRKMWADFIGPKQTTEVPLETILKNASDQLAKPAAIAAQPKE